MKVPALLQPIEDQTAAITPLADAVHAANQHRTQDFVHSLETVAPLNPDQFGAASKLGRAIGVSPDLLYRHQDYAQRILKGNEYTALAEKNQRTAQALRDGNLAAIAQDDIEQLARIEGAASDTRFNQQSFSERLFSGVHKTFLATNQARDTAAADTLNRLRGQFDAVDAEEARALEAGEEPYAAGEVPGGFARDYLLASPEQRQVMRQRIDSRQGQLAEGVVSAQAELDLLPTDPAERRMQELQRNVQIGIPLGGLERQLVEQEPEASSLETTFDTLIEQPEYIPRLVLGTAPTTGPALVAGVFGGPLAAAPISYGAEFNAKFLDVLSEAGINTRDPKAFLRALQDDELMAEARTKSARKAAGTTAVDTLGMFAAGRLLAPSSVGGKALAPTQRELVNLAVQFPVQGLTEGLGEAAGQFAAEGEVDSGEVLLETVAGAGSSVVDVLAFGGPRVYDSLSAGLKATRQARVGKQTLDQASDAAVNGKTRQRDPEAFREIALQQLQDSPLEQIWLPAEALQRLNQSAHIDLPALLAKVPGLSEQFAEAVARDGSVSMKGADYLTYFADYQEQLGDSIRLQADGFSVTDAEAWTAEQEAQLEDLAAQLQAQPDAAVQAQRDTVGELISAGFRRQDAEQYAATHLSVLQNLAERTGLALDQLRQQFPLSIGAQAPADLRAVTVDDARLAIQRLRAGDIPQPGDIFGKSLGEYLRDAGGLNDEGGELAALDIDVGKVGRNRLTRAGGGQSLDQAAMAAWERGYFPGVPREAVGPQLIVDALREELAGNPRYSTEQENATLRDQAATLEQLRDYFGRLDVDLAELSDDEALAILRQPEAIEGRVQEQFAGPTAWTADVPALDEAKARIAQGDNPNTVRQETGWFEGVDGKWRFEIDDSQARFKGFNPDTEEQEVTSTNPDVYMDWIEEAAGRERGIPLGQALHHPALFAAYPELERVRLKVDPQRSAGGYFAHEGRGLAGAEIIIGDPYNYGPQVSPAIDVLMHEVQHAIQTREGFATGGSPAVLRAEKDQATADYNYWRKVAALRTEADRLQGDYQQAARDYTDVFEEAVTEQELEDAQRAESVEQLDQRRDDAEKVMRTIGNPTQTYTNLAGEIEARNTERRRTLTPEERQAASPEQTADVPGERAIVWWQGVEMVSPRVSAQANEELQRLNQSGQQVSTPNQSRADAFAGMTREQFLGNPTITKDSNASTLQPRVLTTVATAEAEPFAAGDGLTARYSPDGAAVYDGDKVVASYNFGDTLVVDKKYRRQGIAAELVYQWRTRNPNTKPARERTKKSQALQEKVWERIERERSQRLEQGGDDDSARGFITFTPRGQGDRRFQITLGDKRDLSTLLHELGHYYLEVIDELAANPEAPTQIRNDVASIRQWLGAEPGTSLTSEQHEQFARGFEAYLAEGKAPNPELAGAFARFKRWLIAIYKDLRRLNVELTDEVRAVFDRLVASDAQIQAAEQVSAAIPLFKEASEAGMSDAEFRAYQDSIELAHADARDAVEEEIVKEEERRHSKWWKEQSAIVREQVAEEIDSLPEYAALRLLRQGIGPNGEPIAIKLPTSELRERYGLPALRKLAFMHTNQGTPIDIVARLVGFDSGDAMVRTLMGMQPRAAVIEQETERRMIEQHGPKVAGEAAERALAAVHNERRAEVLQKELRRLAEVGNRRNLTSQQILKEAARRVISERTVRDIQPVEYQRAEAKASRRAFEAFVKGDLEAAYQAKQQQLLNFYLYKEAVKARDDVRRIVERMQRFNKKTKRESLGKAGADYLDRIDAIMEQYEFRSVSLRQIDKMKSTEAWYYTEIAAGNDPYVPEWMLKDAARINYKDLAYDQLQELHEMAEHVNHLASTKNKLLGNQRIKDLKEAREALAASAFANVDKRPTRHIVANARSLPEVIGDWLSRGNSSLLKMEQVIDWLDGGDPNGAFSTLLFQPLAEAQHQRDTLNKQVTERVVELTNAWMEARGSSMGEIWTVPGIATPMTTNGMLAVALNVGNADNLRKLQAGYGWGDAVIPEVLARMTAADWQYVEQLWRLVDSLWPQIAALEKQVNGIVPPKIEGLQVQTAFGPIQGGYWPLVYDPLSTQYAKVLNNVGGLAPLNEAGGVRATPPRGHTKGRVDGFAAPILLDVGVVGNHLNQVIHDLTHRVALADARRLLDGEAHTALTQTIGPEMAQQFINQLNGIANDQNSGDAKAVGAFSQFMNLLRRNQAVAWMGYSVTTMFNQLGGYAQGLEYFASKSARKYFYRALLKFWADPRGNLAMIRAMSGEMANRAINLDASIREAQQQVIRMKDGRLVQDAFKGMQNGRDIMVKYAFTPIQVMQSVVDGVVWMAGYEQAGGALNHDEAVQAADRAVRLTQTAGGPKDLATIQQNQMAKLFMPVYGYASLLWNRNNDIAREAVRGVKNRNASQVLVALERFIYLNILPAILTGAIKGSLPDDDDDEETWAGYLGIQALLGVASGVPVLGPVAQGFFGEFGYGGASTIGIGFDALIRSSNASQEQAITTNAINAVGAFTGLPSSQLNRAVRTGFLLESGEMEASADAIIRGILFGPKPKDQ